MYCDGILITFLAISLLIVA